MNLLRITIAICTLLLGFAALNRGFPMTLPYWLLWLLFWLTAFVALFRFVTWDRPGTPAAICAATLLLLYLLPLDKLSRYIEFKRNEAEFADIMNRIHAGTIAPEPAAHTPGLPGRHYRTRNKKVVVAERNGQDVICFCGYGDYYAPNEGFVYAPSGSESKSQLQRINEDWYYGRP
jgi:hypothetical protein